MFRLLKTESFKLSNKLKSWLGPLLIMVLVLIAFPLSIDISQYDLDKFYQFPYGFHLVFNGMAVIVQYIIISEYKSVSKKRTNKQIKVTKQCDKVCFEQDGHQTRQLRSIYITHLVLL